MATTISVDGKKPKKGARMTKRTQWKIVAVTGRKREFRGTLLQTITFAGKRLAIFSVQK